MTYVHRCACGEPQVACCCHLLVTCAATLATCAPRDALTLLADETVDDAGDADFERVRAEVRRRLVGGAT